MLKPMFLSEAMARGYYILLENRKRGKKSRRVEFLLPSNRIPMFGTEWQEVEFFGGGVLRIRSWFDKVRGRWGITIVFPSEDGFTVGDHIPKTPKS